MGLTLRESKPLEANNFYLFTFPIFIHKISPALGFGAFVKLIIKESNVLQRSI